MNCLKSIRCLLQYESLGKKSEFNEQEVIAYLKFLNRNLRQIQSDSAYLMQLQHDKIILLIRHFLLFNHPLVRCHAIRFFALLLTNSAVATLFIHKNITFFLAKVLESDNTPQRDPQRDSPLPKDI